MNTTRLGKGRVRISITVDEKLMRRADKVAKQQGKSRAEIMSTWIEDQVREQEWLERFAGKRGFFVVEKVVFRAERRFFDVEKRFRGASDDEMKSLEVGRLPQEVVECMSDEDFERLCNPPLEGGEN